MKPLFLAFILTMLFSATQAQNLQTLKSQIENDFKSVPGTFALAVKDLASSETLLMNEHVSFHAASTMKTPVMVEVFHQAKMGRFSLHDSIEVRNEFRSIVDGSSYSLDLKDDSDDSMYGRIGSRASIEDLVYQMITVSSNLATNILVDLVRASNVNATVQSMGAKDMEVLRGVEDIKAFDRGMNNTTTAEDLLKIFEAIGKKTVVDSVSCQKMLDILSDQKFREKIPALLPPGTRVAHKTGNISGVEHDSGIVFLPDGRSYVIVILSKDLKDAKAAKEVMARVSKRVYDVLADKR